MARYYFYDYTTFNERTPHAAKQRAFWGLGFLSKKINKEARSSRAGARSHNYNNYFIRGRYTVYNISNYYK
jgi:hypothetical protein